MELDSSGGECRRRQTGDNKVFLEIRETKTTRSWSSSGKSFLSILIILLFCVHLGTALKCYHCLERPKSTEKHLACAYFDKSSKFHKECTHSSFCMKRTSQFQLHNGSYVDIYVYKCADQSHRTMIQDKNGEWIWGQLFRKDLYNEGCFPHNTPSMLTTDSYHCFCSTDFCNGSPATVPPSSFFLPINCLLCFLPLLFSQFL